MQRKIKCCRNKTSSATQNNHTNNICLSSNEAYNLVSPEQERSIALLPNKAYGLIHHGPEKENSDGYITIWGPFYSECIDYKSMNRVK